MYDCSDWVEVTTTTTQRYCDSISSIHPCGEYPCSLCDYCGSTPAPVTATTITVKFTSDGYYTGKGFLATVCCSANITTDVTGE